MVIVDTSLHLQHILPAYAASYLVQMQLPRDSATGKSIDVSCRSSWDVSRRSFGRGMEIPLSTGMVVECNVVREYLDVKERERSVSVTERVFKERKWPLSTIKRCDIASSRRESSFEAQLQSPGWRIFASLFRFDAGGLRCYSMRTRRTVKESVDGRAAGAPSARQFPFVVPLVTGKNVQRASPDSATANSRHQSRPTCSSMHHQRGKGTSREQGYRYRCLMSICPYEFSSEMPTSIGQLKSIGILFSPTKLKNIRRPPTPLAKDIGPHSFDSF